MTELFEIWHNPRCSKSRATLALLQERGLSPVVRLYQLNGPTERELRDVLAELGILPAQVVRSGDKLFKELGLTKDLDDDALIAAMVAHPALIERPIVRKGGKARIGRPPESVMEIL